jgi:pilus assembly protein CpaC
VIFVTPVISDPALEPNTGLLERADRIDQGFRKEYGHPEPLVSDEEKATHTSAPRQPIEATPALLPAPLRSTPAVEQTRAPLSVSDRALSQPSDSARAQVPALAPVQASAANSTPANPAPPMMRASTPPAGVAEALRMLSAAQQAPTAPQEPQEATQSALNGKVPSQQVGVLGNAAH